MLLLPIEEQFLLVGIRQNMQDNPFCYLGSVYPGGIRDGNIGLLPDGCVCQTIGSCTEEVDQFEVFGELDIHGEGR